MIDRETLFQLARALPAGSSFPMPRDWVLELLQGFQCHPKPPTVIEVDLTPEEVGEALHRSPVTIRSYCNAGLFRGAYRLRGPQWRTPRASLETFQAAEQKTH